MKIFIDSAKQSEIQEACETGLIDGVTTNPSLLKKATQEIAKHLTTKALDRYIRQVLKTAKGKPVSLEVTKTTYDEMLAQAYQLYKKYNTYGKNVVIKIPINPSFSSKPSFTGIKVIKELSKKNIPVNATLIFTPQQALLAAKAGARYVSPFVGRLDDYLRNKAKKKFKKTDYFPAQGLQKNGELVNSDGIVSGVHLVEEIANLFETHKIQTKIIAASIRNSQQFMEVGLVGAHIATVPPSVFTSLFTHSKTQEGMKLFSKDVVKEYEQLLK